MGVVPVKFILLVTSFIVPMLFAIILLAQRNKSLSNKLIVFAMLNATAVFFFNYLYFEGLYRAYYYTNSWHIMTLLWVFPSIYLIIKQAIFANVCLKKEYYHFLPGILIASAMSVLLFGFCDVETATPYFENYRNNAFSKSPILETVAILRYINVVVLVLQIVFYLAKILGLPRHLKNALLNEYSYEKNVSTNWIVFVDIAFATLGALCILYYVYVPKQSHEDIFLIVFMFFISGFIMYVGVMALLQKEPDTTLVIDCADAESAVNKTETTICCSDTAIVEPKLHDTEFIEKLLAKMNDDKLYLKADLSLVELAKALSTNRSYLSCIINQHFDVNFNAFVNNFRIKYIEEFAKENPNSKAEELSAIGGFGSVSSMRRAMKRVK